MTHTVKQALLSVSDKTGIIDLARALSARGIALLSTGGTAKMLVEAASRSPRWPTTPAFRRCSMVASRHCIRKCMVACWHDVTMLHTWAALAAHAIPTIDLLVVNLYPFEATVAKPGVELSDAIENIDIGGPTTIRAAAKNYGGVAVVVDPLDYATVLSEIEATGGVSDTTRFTLAKKVFTHTARYDGAITNFLTSLDDAGSAGPFPDRLKPALREGRDLRYGENPHQGAAFYRDVKHLLARWPTTVNCKARHCPTTTWPDADAAWECVKSF